MSASLDIPKLDALCAQLYTSAALSDRKHAELHLSACFPNFTANSAQIYAAPNILGFVPASPWDQVLTCQFILRNTTSAYTLTYVLSYLRLLVSNYLSVLSKEQKNQFRLFVLQFTFQNAQMPSFALTSLSTLYALILKLGWADIPKQDKNFIEDIKQFLTSSSECRLAGLELMATLVAEMNVFPLGQSQRYRKTANLFRDNLLFKIYELCLDFLRGLYGKTLGFQEPRSESRAKELCLKCVLNCLSFDFIGSSPDDSSDEVTVVQLPSAWRASMETEANIQLFFDCYASFSEHSKDVLECLVQIASVRKSLFNNDEMKRKFVSFITRNFLNIVKHGIGLQSPENFHQLCRFLARLKNSYQLTELSEIPEYQEWIVVVTDFTIKGFQSWEWSPNSVQYLLFFWLKLISASTSQRTDSFQNIEEHALSVSKAFIQVCVEVASGWVESVGKEDPLDNEEQLLVLFEYLAGFSRCKYEEATSFCIGIFDNYFTQYKNLVAGNRMNTNEQALLLLQSKLSWLVYIMGGMMTSRTVYSSTDYHDERDADITHRMISLLNFNQKTLLEQFNVSYEKLDLALLFYLSQFRKTYVGDSAQRASQLFQRLAVQYGFSDLESLMDDILRKLATNLKVWHEVPNIIRRTIKIFSELTVGYGSIKLLNKIETTKLILQNHSTFEFLNELGNVKCRTEFYSALSRLIFAEESSTIEEDFQKFVQPFEFKIREVLSLTSPEDFRRDVVRKTVVGIFRDLRGVCQALLTKRHYTLVFDWFFPNLMPIVMKTIEIYPSDTLVITSCLKFFHEFILNRSSRLTFDISSANGILLFRETSKVLVLYSQYIKHCKNAPPVADVYAARYKAMASCFGIMGAALSGRYIAFGVFKLYGDPAYSNAIEAIVEFIRALPAEDIRNYPKLSKSYHTLVEVIAKDYIDTLSSVDSEFYLHFMKTIDEGIRSCDSFAIVQSSTTLEHIVSHVYNQLSAKKPPTNVFALYYSQFPGVYATLTTSVLSVFMNEDEYTWTLSRCLLPIILINRPAFDEVLNGIIQRLPFERRNHVIQAVTKLLDGVEQNLNPKNRDKFTANSSLFVRELQNPPVVAMNSDIEIDRVGAGAQAQHRAASLPSIISDK